MPTFTVTQNRKPWNNLVRWLYAQAENIALHAAALGVRDIDDFHKMLQARLNARTEHHKTASRINIHCWGGKYCGINRANRAEGPGLTIKLLDL